MFSRRYRAAVLCCGIGLAAVIPAMADPAADARKAIEANYTQMAKAYAGKDSFAYGAFLAKDVVFLPKSGQTLRKQPYLAGVRELFTKSKSIQLASKIEKFALQKEKAVATVRQKVTALMHNGQTDKDELFVIVQLNEAVWVRSGSNWLLQKEKEVSSTLTIGGKSVPFR